MDRLGMILSVLCMVHCAAMPFLLAWLPMLGRSWLADETAHRWLALAAMLLGVLTFVPGLRVHRRWSVLAFAVVGLSLITHAAYAYSDTCCRVPNTISAEDSEETPACCRHCQPAGLGTTPPAFAPLQTPLGGLLLVVAHVLNLRGRRCCSRCEQRREDVFIGDLETGVGDAR